MSGCDGQEDILQLGIGGRYGEVVEVPKHLRSRLLYSNPVCLLSTAARTCSGALKRNLMTISWITPLNNDGRVLMSMNERRYSAELLQQSKRLVLSVAVEGMEDALTAVGSCHGSDTFDKCKDSSIMSKVGPLCKPGWKGAAQEDVEDPTDQAMEMPSGSIAAVAGAVAHLEIQVDTVPPPEHGHLLLQGLITAAFVRKRYWHEGKLFFAEPGLPNILSFLGTKRFAVIRPQ